MKVWVIFDSYGNRAQAILADSEKEAVGLAFKGDLGGYIDFQHGGRIEEFVPGQIAQTDYSKSLEEKLRHAVECCSAFQSGGEFDHLSKFGESIFDAVPRLVALAVEKGLG